MKKTTKVFLINTVIMFAFLMSFFIGNKIVSVFANENDDVPEMAKVFEEPITYELNSLNLKDSEVGEVQNGGSAENDLFEFEAFIKDSEIKDGTAPFDKDDQAGNDSSENNGIIRTFDTATYPIKVTINPKKVSKLNNIVLRISGTLENGISENRVNAKFSVGGYEDIVQNIVGFEQIYTIEQTGNSIMIPISIDVQGAKSGIKMIPKFKVEVISVDGKDIKEDNVAMEFNELPSLTTSGKVNIKAYAGKHNYGSNTFLSVPYAVIDTNTEKNTNIFGFYIAMGLQKLEGKTDIRGSTFPTGKIKYHVDLDGYVAWDSGNKSGKSEKLKFDGRDTPLYVLDHTPIDSITKKIGSRNTLLEGETYHFAYPNGYPTARSNIPDLSPKNIKTRSPYSVWDSGKWEVTKPKVESSKVTYEGEMKDYIIGSTFPEYRADGYTGYKIYGKEDKVFATNGFMVEQPNEYVIGGKNNPEGLANNVYYEANITIDSYEDENGNEVILNKTAKAISSERNNPDGAMHVQNTFIDYKSGQQLGTPNIGNGAVSKGDASTILGNDVRFRGYGRSSIINYGGFDLVLRWNTDTFEMTREYAQEAFNRIMSEGYRNRTGQFTKYDYEKQKVFYGLAKFEDNSFDNFTNKADQDYTWYSDYTEAMKHGDIGAIKVAVNDTVSASSFISWQIPLHVKTTKIGSFNEKDTANIAVTNLYAYPSKDRTRKIDVSKGKSYQSPALWEAGELIKKQAPSGDSVNFETLAVLNAETSSSITTDKPTYYNSETVDWKIESSIILPPTGAPDNYDGSVEVRQILPKGLDYKVGSGKQGKLSKEPKIIKNENGTTTLIWELLVSRNNVIDDVTFSTTINPFALSGGGVQSILKVTNIISSPLDTRKEHLRTSTHSINILKVGMVGVYSSIDRLYGEKNSSYEVTLNPYTTIEEEYDVKGLTLIPLSGDKIGSDYVGKANIDNIEINSDKPVTVYLNNSLIESNMPHKIDVTKNGWYKYTGKEQDISKAVSMLFHIEGVLKNTDQIEVKYRIQTKNNNFGNIYMNETVINSATDYKLSPISNKLKYTIRADAELSMERIQIYTGNANERLPIKLRINKELNKETAVNEALKLVVYEKDSNKKVFSKDFTVGSLQRENELEVLAEYLVKDTNRSYEIRVEGYNTDRIYVKEEAQKIDTLGYTASEKTIKQQAENGSEIKYKGVVMTEREIGKEIETFYETLTLPIKKIAPLKSGYGFSLDQTLLYTNDTGLGSIVPAPMEALLDMEVTDGDFYEIVDGKSKIELISEEIIEGDTITQSLGFPEVFIKGKNGKVISEHQYTELNNNGLTTEIVDGGNKVYVPIWIDELGSYEYLLRNTAPIGVNEVNISINDTVDVTAYMYGHIGSETIKNDEILIVPIDLGNPFPNGLPKGWTEQDLKWLQGE